MRTETYDSKESHADVHPIFHLPEISSAGIGIQFRSDLIYSRQRMHHYHITLGLRKTLGCNNVGPFHLLKEIKIIVDLSTIYFFQYLVVFLFGSETLFLDPSHIENVGAFDDVIQIGVLLLRYALLFHFVENSSRHAKGLRRDVVELTDRVER